MPEATPQSEMATPFENYLSDLYWAFRPIHLHFFPCNFDFIETSSLRERIRAARLPLHKTASRQRGVCVKHLKRWKTSTLVVFYFSVSWITQGLIFINLCMYVCIQQGAQVWLWFLCQRKRPEVTVISKGDVPLTYLLQISFFMSIFCNGTWLTQEPPCRFLTTPVHGFIRSPQSDHFTLSIEEEGPALIWFI